MKLPVYSRADLSRTVVPAVAPFLTAGSTGAVARAFRAATRSEDHPTVRMPRDMGRGGSRIRVERSRLISDMIGAPGAVPAHGPVLAMRTTGLIDGAEDNRPSFVAADHYKYAGRYIAESTMSLEVLVMSPKARENLLAGGRKILRDAATGGIDAMARRDHAAAKPIERMRKVE
jgi:TRAP-type C4-dicarboxylate transport system substrate-binding protein